MDPATDWVAGKLNNALDFDGIDDCVAVNNVPVNTATGAQNTVAFWMYWDGTKDVMPFGWGSPYDLWFHSTANNFGFNTANADVLGILTDGLTNRWVHVTAIFYNGVPNPSTVMIS